MLYSIKSHKSRKCKFNSRYIISATLSSDLTTYDLSYGNKTYTLRYPANTWELLRENDEIKLINKNNLDITLSIRIKSKYSGGGYCYEISERDSNSINGSINFKVFQGQKAETEPCLEMLPADAKKYLIYAVIDLTNETVLEIEGATNNSDLSEIQEEIIFDIICNFEFEKLVEVKLISPHQMNDEPNYSVYYPESKWTYDFNQGLYSFTKKDNPSLNFILEPGFVHTGGYYCYEFDADNQIEKLVNGFNTVYVKAQRISAPTELCDQNSINSTSKYMFLIAIYVSDFELYKVTYFSENNDLDEISQLVYGEILPNFFIDFERN